jgi:hypothetical protein
MVINAETIVSASKIKVTDYAKASAFEVTIEVGFLMPPPLPL